MKKDRPYIGVVLSINGYNYFAPLTSAKDSKEKLNNQTVVKLFDGSDFLGAIRFNNMIPCNDEHIELLQINSIADEDYRILVNKQYSLINYTYRERIIKKANKLYKVKKDRPGDFASSLCCDFTKLEQNI